MFCSSLRKRREWAQVPATLLSQQQPRWAEQPLETHDLALPLPNGPSQIQAQQEWFRLLLLSPSNMEPASAHITRIERLYHQTGGLNIGIVFLLRDNSSRVDGTQALMNLQLSLLSTFEMPIIPLFSVSALQQSVSSFQRQLVQSRIATRPPINPSTALLPYCSVSGLIPEHTRNVLSDICHSIPEIAQAATTQDGQDILRQWLSEPSPTVVENIIEFWKQEYIVG